MAHPLIIFATALTATEWALLMSGFAAMLTVIWSALRGRNNGRNHETDYGSIIIDQSKGSSVLIEGAVRGMTVALAEKEEQLMAMRAERDDLRRKLLECEEKHRHGTTSRAE
jgi:hypothetical protein